MMHCQQLHCEQHLELSLTMQRYTAQVEMPLYVLFQFQCALHVSLPEQHYNKHVLQS